MAASRRGSSDHGVGWPGAGAELTHGPSGEIAPPWANAGTMSAGTLAIVGGYASSRARAAIDGVGVESMDNSTSRRCASQPSSSAGASRSSHAPPHSTRTSAVSGGTGIARPHAETSGVADDGGLLIAIGVVTPPPPQEQSATTSRIGPTAAAPGGWHRRGGRWGARGRDEFEIRFDMRTLRDRRRVTDGAVDRDR